MQTRIVVLGDAWDLLKFLDEARTPSTRRPAAKELGADAGAGPRRRAGRAGGRRGLVGREHRDGAEDGADRRLALKPRKAFGPIRVAATGSSVSPPLFESLELLGRDRSLQPVAGRREPRPPPRRREKRAPESLVVCTSAR